MASAENDGKNPGSKPDDAADTGPGATLGPSAVTPHMAPEVSAPDAINLDEDDEVEVEVVQTPAEPGWEQAVEEWSEQIYIEPSLREPLPGSYARAAEEGEGLPPLPSERRLLPEEDEAIASPGTDPGHRRQAVSAEAVDLMVDDAQVESELPSPLPPPPPSTASAAGAVDDFYDDIAIEKGEARESMDEARGAPRQPESALPELDGDEDLDLDLGESLPPAAPRFSSDDDFTPVPGGEPPAAAPSAASGPPRTIHMEADLPPGAPEPRHLEDLAGSAVTPAAPAAVVAAALAASAATPSERIVPPAASTVTLSSPPGTVTAMALTPPVTTIAGAERSGARFIEEEQRPAGLIEATARLIIASEVRLPSPLEGSARSLPALARSETARGASAGSVPPSGQTPLSAPAALSALLSRPSMSSSPALQPQRLPLPLATELPAPPTLRSGAARGLPAATRKAWTQILDGEARRLVPQEAVRAAGLLSVAAHQAEALGEMGDASDRYRSALERSPQSRPALRGLRRILAQPGPAAQADEAAQLLERELEGAADATERAALLLLRGELFLHLGQEAGARTCYQELLLNGGGRFAALSGLADAAALRGPANQSDLAAAADALADALAAGEPGPTALRVALLIERARIDEHAGRLPAARARYEAALAGAGVEAGLPVGFGLLRLSLRGAVPAVAPRTGRSSRPALAPATETASAVQDLRRLQGQAQGALLGALGPSLLRAALLRQQALLEPPRAGADSNDATLAWLRTAADDGDAVAREDLAERLARSGQAEESARLLYALAGALSPTSGQEVLRADLYARAGARFAEAGRYQEAREALSAAADSQPGLRGDALAQRELRRVQELEGRPDDQRDLLKQAAAEHAGQGAYFLVAQARLALLQAGAAPEALRAAQDTAQEALLTALRARPRFGPALSLLRDVLVAQGQPEAAAQALLTWAAPTDLVLREEAAGLLWRAGMEVAAARLLLSTEDDSLRLRAALRWQVQRLLWTKVGLAPESKADLAGLLAETLFVEAESSPDMQRVADLWYRRGLLMHRLHPQVTREAGPAEDSLARALLAEPAHGEALSVLLERALAAEGQTARGALIPLLLRVLRERLASSQGRPEATVLLSRLAALQQHDAGDPSGALQTLDVLHALAPLVMPGAAEDPLLLHLALRAGLDGRVIELWDAELSATEDLERRFSLLLLIGEWQRAAGDATQAAQRFSMALELRPGHPVAREALADALELSGQWDELTRMARAEAEEGQDIGQRIAGYERLAALGIKRQQPEATVQACHDILTLDANHHLAMRALERHYIARRDDGELVHLYSQMGLVATDPAFAVHVHLERARLRQRLAWQSEAAGRPQEELQSELENDFRLALYRDGHSRPALRQLLATALRTHDLQQVADLSTRLSDICDQSGTGRGEAGDGRAAAVFLTRAAECYRTLGRSPEFVAQAYRAALERNPRHVPALRGLLHLLLEQQGYTDAVAVAELLAAAMHDPEERYDALLVAATVAQEQLGDLARAIQMLRAALLIGVARSDAFDRLRVIFAGLAGVSGDPLALADLLSERMQVESDPRRLLALRLELGLLARDALGDRARAKAELRAALAIEPSNEDVLAALADLHFGDSEWSEASELLLRRARVERRTEALVAIYLRLGEIFAQHLPEPRRAALAYTRVLELQPEHVDGLTRLAALYQQQGRAEAAVPLLVRLADLSGDREQKIVYLHRLAHLQEARGDKRGALDALRQAVDLDPMYLPAVGELARFFDLQSDVQSMRVHLDRSAARWHQVLRERPDDSRAYRALLQIFLWRRAGDQATMAAEILAVLEGEAALPPEATALLQVQARKAGYPGDTLRDPSWDDQLFPPSIPAGLRMLFDLLHEPLEKLHRMDSKHLAQAGIEKRERLPRSGHSLRELANRIAADLGIPFEFDIYLTAAQGKDSAGRPAPLCTLEATDPPALVLSQQLTTGASEDELRFYLGRLLKLLQRRLILPLRLSPDNLGLLVGGLVRQFVPDYVPIGFAEKRIAAEAQQLARVIPRKLHPQVLPLAMECASASLDPAQVEETLLHCANHAGLLIVGRLRPAYAALRRLGPSAEGQVTDLLRFAVSPEFAEIRRTLGTNLG